MDNFTCKHCKAETLGGSVVESDDYCKNWKCPACNCWNKLIPTAEDKAFEIIERKQEANQIHPLLNPDSKHYSMVDDVEAIVRMEQMYDTEELMVWAKITAMKYRLRIGNKDDVLKEAKKLLGYEAYYTYLKNKS